MMTRTVANVAVMAALGLLAPLNASAFGLGKLELSSALNEPFKAEIAITALQGNDADNLQVRLASSKEFKQAGIERNFLLTQLKFDVIETSGTVKILISSEQPIREPFLDFLLTATTTGSGRLIREYTVLLDPPKNIFKKSVEPAASKPLITSTSASSDKKKPSVSIPDSYGPTTRNDTLWDVALKTRPERSISVHQMMIALVEANPRAFQHNNVNGLKAGYRLSVPSKPEINKLTKQQAINAVREQNVLWKNRNVRQTMVTETTDDIAASTNALSPITAETTSISADVEDSARLKLVAPNDESSLTDDALSPLGSDKIKELSEQLTLAQETIEGQTQENIDFKARMDAMEEQMETMRRLISLKDADLARLQSMLEQDIPSQEMSPNADNLLQEDVADGSASEQLISEQADEMSSVEKWEALISNSDNENKPAPITSEPEITQVIEPVVSDAETGEDVSQHSILSTDVISSEVNNPSEEGLQRILNISKQFVSDQIVLAEKFVAKNKLEILIASGSILVLLSGLLFFKRRKESDYSWDEGQTEYESDEKSSVVIQPTSNNTNEVEEAVSASGIEQSVETVSDAKTAADLIEQADLLVAYNDFDQALTTLNQAQSLEPSNEAVMLKRLFVLFKKQLKEPFVTLASSMNIDKDSSEWAEISEWGRDLAPLEPLFNITVNEESATDLTMDNVVAVQNEELVLDLTPEQSTSESSETEEFSSDTIEFNLDDYRTEALVTPDTSESLAEDKIENDDSLSFSTEFSLDAENSHDDFDVPLSFENETKTDISVLSLDDEPLSLDLNEPSLDIEAPELRINDDLAIDAIQSLNVDTSMESEHDSFGFDINGYDEIDEAETKLDLAAAYADMGDPDGARNILEEVINEGNDEQKSRAQALLENLS